MNDQDKLTLLKLATQIYFTDCNDFFHRLHAEFGTEKCTLADLESFFAESIDFQQVPQRPVEQDVAIEVPSLDEIEEETSDERKQELRQEASSPRPPVAREAMTATPESSASASRPLSPSTAIPVKTPSGRTLRSTVAVAPSEPRRLRSSKQ